MTFVLLYKSFQVFDHCNKFAKKGGFSQFMSREKCRAQCEQDKIADYTLPTSANDSMNIHSTRKFKNSKDTNFPKMNGTEPNSLPQITSESIARETLDSSLTTDLENSTDA